MLAALAFGGTLLIAGCCPLFPPPDNGNDNQNSANTNQNGNVNGNANTNVNGNANTNINGNTNQNTGNTNANTADNFSITDIAIQKDGMVAAGDRIVAFGSTPGGTVGVSYVNVPDNTPIPITGDFRGDAVYCAGKKVVLISSGATRGVSIFNTTTSMLEAIPDTNVFDISPGAAMENDYIAVSGNLVAILHRDPNLTNKVLKVIDVSTTPATVRTFTRVLTNALAVEIDAATNRAVVLEDNIQFAVFELAGELDQIPNSFNIQAMASLAASSTPKFKFGSNLILFRENNTGVIRTLSAATGLLSVLLVNPIATDPTFNFDNEGGRFAYFLQRLGQDDVDLTQNQQGNRVAVGLASNLAQLTPGGGGDLGNGARAGFGRSVAIAPDGSAVYVAGRFGQSTGGGVNLPSFLQVNTGSGFVLLGDADDPAVEAADPSVSANTVAFKVATEDGGATLGWFLP